MYWTTSTYDVFLHQDSVCCMTRLCPPRPLLTRSRSCSIDSVTHSSGTPPGGGDTNRGRDTCARVSPAITHPHFDTTLCSIDLSVLAAITGIFLDTLRHRHISVIAVGMADRYWYRSVGVYRGTSQRCVAVSIPCHMRESGGNESIT